MATKAIKLPSGSWRVRVQIPSDDNKQHYKSFSAPTRKEAEYLAAQYALTLKDTVHSNAASITVGRAIDAYIKNRTNVLSPTSIASYKKLRRNYYASVENLLVSALTATDAQLLINESCVGHSPKTVREIYSLFRSSVRQYAPDYSPVVNLPAMVRHEMHIPKEESVVKMLNLAADTPMATAILLSAAYGLRRGEISALTYADLNVSDKTLTINKAYAKTYDCKWVIKAPKSYAGTRTIQLSDSIIASLVRPNASPSDPICPLLPDVITHRFEKLRDAVGISVRFHDLRHYNASLMLSLNVPDKYAMERLGQATPSMLKSVYQHVMDEKRESVNAVMENAVISLLDKI